MIIRVSLSIHPIYHIFRRLSLLLVIFQPLIGVTDDEIEFVFDDVHGNEAIAVYEFSRTENTIAIGGIRYTRVN